MVRASSIDSTVITTAAIRNTLKIAQPLGLDHLLDVGALRRQQQRAAHGAEALHRRRDRDDHLAALIDAHDRLVLPLSAGTTSG